MAIPMFLEDMSIISKLGNKPGEDDGLSTPQFRAKFDEGAQKIQNYINKTLVPAIENTAPGLYSVTMDLAVCNLRYYKWENNLQTIAVSKVIPDIYKQAILSVADYGSLEAYLDCNIRLESQNDGSVTFSCDDVPDSDVVVKLMILTKGD